VLSPNSEVSRRAAESGGLPEAVRAFAGKFPRTEGQPKRKKSESLLGLPALWQGIRTVTPVPADCASDKGSLNLKLFN